MVKKKDFDKTVIDDSVNPKSGVNSINQSDKKKTLKFKNLTPRQKKLLESSATGLSGIALGALAMALMGASGGKIEEENEVPDIVISGETVEIPIYPEAPFSNAVNDDMSFGEAFAAARKDVGAGGFFEWKGASYNTYYKEEWDALTPEEQKEFMASVNPNTEGEFLDEEAIVNILNGEEEDIDFLDHEDIVIIDNESDSPIDLTDVVIIDDEIMEIDELSDVVIIDDNIDHFADDPFGPDIFIDGDDDIIELG